MLDEERVATHLETLMNIVLEEKFDSRKHTMEVITVLFEVRAAHYQQCNVFVAGFSVP